MAKAHTLDAGRVISPSKEALDVGPYGSLRWILLFGLVMAAILEVLDTSIINPVLPTMAGNLGCTFQEVGWVSTSYILANVIVLPMTAWLAQRFGLRAYLLVSIGGFIGSSALCGFAHSLNEMIAYRLVQGAAGASLISMTQAALVEVFPAREVPMSQGIWALGITVAPALAPTLGGWITDNYAWPWIFFINVPMGLVAMYVIGTFYKGAGAQKGGRVDWIGIGLLAAGLGSIQYVLEEGEQNDWLADPLILRLTVIGIVSCIVFVWWQLSKWNKSPVVDLKVFSNRGLSGAAVVMLMAGCGLYGGLFLFPLFGQSVLGFTPTANGLFLFVPGLVLGFSMIVTSVLMQKGVPGRDIAMLGAAALVVGMWMLGHMTPMSNESDARVALMVTRLGLGMLMLSVIVAGVATLPPSQIKQGSALLGLARQLGGSFGIAALSTYVTQMTQFHRYDLAAKVYDGNPLAVDRLNTFSGFFHSQGMDLDHARSAAESVLDGQIQRQAYTLAIDNAHVVIGLLFVVTIPCLFLLKRSGGSAAGAAAH